MIWVANGAGLQHQVAGNVLVCMMRVARLCFLRSPTAANLPSEGTNTSSLRSEPRVIYLDRYRRVVFLAIAHTSTDAGPKAARPGRGRGPFAEPCRRTIRAASARRTCRARRGPMSPGHAFAAPPAAGRRWMAKATLSSMVSHGMSRGSWKTMPTSGRGASISWRFRRTGPSSAGPGRR